MTIDAKYKIAVQALIEIANYADTGDLEDDDKRLVGLGRREFIEMSYDNIKFTALVALRRLREEK